MKPPDPAFVQAMTSFNDACHLRPRDNTDISRGAEVTEQLNAVSVAREALKHLRPNLSDEQRERIVMRAFYEEL